MTACLQGDRSIRGWFAIHQQNLREDNEDDEEETREEEDNKPRKKAKVAAPRI